MAKTREDDCLLDDRGKRIARLFKRAGDQRWRIALKDPVSGKWSERVGTKSRPQSATYMHTLVEELKEKEKNNADPFREHRARGILEHADDYVNHIRNLDRCEGHITITESRIRCVIKACKFKILDDLDPSKIETCLRRWREEREDFGIRTSNHYVQSLKMFELFCLNRGRVPRRKLGVLKPLRNTEPRRQRRALTGEEVDKLLHAARTSARIVQGMTGPQRATLYDFAIRTALRASEIRSIRPRDFVRDGDRLFVRVRAKISKNSKEALVPIRSDHAETLSLILDQTPEDEPIWRGQWNKDAARMLRVDLEAARVPFLDGQGDRCDFHALRHTCVTRWVRAGLDPAVVQRLARHSTIQQTMGFYCHLRAVDLAKDVEGTLEKSVQKPYRKTAS